LESQRSQARNLVIGDPSPTVAHFACRGDRVVGHAREQEREEVGIRQHCGRLTRQALARQIQEAKPSLLKDGRLEVQRLDLLDQSSQLLLVRH